MSTSKRRRYTRYEINLAATLVADNSSFIQCVIRDFCSGGMFIEVKQGKGLHSLKQNQIIQVQFITKLDQGEEEFSLEVQIMHIKSIGIGVAFEGNSEQAFKVLKKQIQNSLGLAGVERRNNLESQAKQDKLETDLSSLMKEAFSSIIDKYYSHIKLKLAEVIEKGGGYQEQRILNDAITNFKINKEVFVESFCSVTDQDSSLLSSSPFNQIDETQAESCLSLVEKNDFEDWLNLSSIIRHLETLFEGELKSLQDKMGYILEVDSNILLNPLCPAKLCDRFRDTLSEIEENDLTKRSMYVLFEETLINYLSELYGKMDAILLANGAPKKLEGVSRSFKKIAPGTSPIIDHHPSQEGDSVRQISENSVDSESNPIATVDSKLDFPTAQPQDSVQSNTQVVNVARNLISLLQQQNSLHQHQTLITTPEITGDVYSSDEISKAFAYIQEHAIQADLTSNNVQEELQDALGNFSDFQKQISSEDKSSLEIHENLFDILFNDKMVTKESESYLDSIKIPIMAQALQDNGFLESENHPSFNIVNHLLCFVSAIKGVKTSNSIKIRQTLDELTKKISIEGIKNPAVFKQAEQKLDEITQSVNKSIDHNIKRVNDTYEGKQKLDKARQFVQVEINNDFAGKKIPNIVGTLLNAGWQHLLVIDKLHEDTNNFQGHLGIINSILKWLMGAKKPRNEVIENVLEFVDTELQPVCTNTFLHSKILDELSDLLLKNSIPLNSNAMDMVLLEKDVTVQALDKESYPLEEVDHLKIGEWLIFLLEEEVEPLKLVWMSEIRDLFVFVNRGGLKKQEFDRETLADMVRNGAANRIESLDMPAMDRATNMMLQNLQQKLVYNATRDSVTGVFNRKEFIKRLKIKLTNLDNAKYLLCNIEVQDFRIITNACGLAAGDALLEQMANTLKKVLRKDDIFGRLDDKTFSILLKNCSAEVAQKLQSELISGEFNWEDKSYAVAAGMGIVPLFSGNSYDVNSILQYADSATLSAINAGRNRIRVYQDNDESLKSQYNAHEWVGRINQVFAENRLFLRCQKIAAINPEKGSHTHYEILLGIKDEQGNTIPPDDFIPAVERCQRMSEVDQWVVLNVFDWIENNQDIFDELDGFSINLSGESMNSEDFLQFLKETLTLCNVPLEKITFEITETVAADSFEFVQSFIKKIKRFKCKFSLDDFGSGYSSYSYLKSLDVDYLKIDGIFVKDMVTNSTDVAIVKSMNEIGHSLNMQTIAEYVESDEIHQMLREIGVDYAQGWGVQKPILITELTDKFLDHQKPKTNDEKVGSAL
jgi:diguanylate cyclase (GGDEF)-like protein